MKLCLILLVQISYLCDCYRILGVFPFHAKSHFIMFEQLMKGLARKGHQVDVISTFPLKKPYPNYTDLVVITPPYNFVNNMSFDTMNNLVTSIPVHAISTLAGNEICEQLGKPEILELAKNPPKDPPYDLVMIEIFGAHCFAVFGHIFNVPVIGLSSSVLYPWANGMIANPENLAFVANNLLNFVHPMTFYERLYNVVHTTFNKVYFDYLTAEQDHIIRKYLGPDMPGVRELESRMAIIIANSHFTLNGVKPTVPGLIEVGGLHVQDEDLKLTPDLERWMNESTKGFVYFTFGSMVKIESFPREVLDVFYKSLGKIAPVRVLMKVPNPSELPHGLPKNIRTEPWMPQLKVLKHKNIKAFITHGGLMGTQEAVSCGVPMIGIPLFADQFINIDTYVARNIAVRLDYKEITEEKMDAALNEVLKPVYMKTAKIISSRFLDRPLTAMDTAIYWIEYIIKYGDNVLRSPEMDLPWWKVALLDVYLFLLAVIALTTLILVTIVKTVINIVCPRQHVHVSRAKKVT